GKRLSREEQIKHEDNPLELWDLLNELACRNEPPAGPDNFRFRFHGLFNVAPAQDGLMCRLRIPGGALTPAQLEAVADCAESYGGGYADITTRANLQIREIAPRHMPALLTALHDAGIVPRGSGADNIRNVTGNPTAGIDPDELYDVLPLCRAMHHHILMNRELYGLPRKFNIAFDGGGSISCLEDTNDIGFRAVRVDASEPRQDQGVERATPAVPDGVYFRVALGGITGHRDFARDCGLLLKPEECVAVAAAMVKVFIAHGDRGNRNKARLKYLLDAQGVEWFLAETEKVWGHPLRRYPRAACRFAPAADRLAHLGVQAQRQPGLFWVGAQVPAGRLRVAQMREVAALARRFGTGSEARPPVGEARRNIRLTVWQNLLVTDIPQGHTAACAAALRDLGLPAESDIVAAGLVACTGAEGCRFGQAPTKATARAIAAHLREARAEGRLPLDGPVNIHLTGCPHSCAQHFIGDLGLIATTIERGGEVSGAFHIFVGGGVQDQARIAVPARHGVPCADVPAVLEEMLRMYLDARTGRETFSDFTARQADADLIRFFSAGGRGGGWPHDAEHDHPEAIPA
ncbi:MAG TPA: NirA family protein, partial [Fibrobacteria bacterium]|nr:NirA family protein [Fibrobacteria bacterium]